MEFSPIPSSQIERYDQPNGQINVVTTSYGHLGKSFHHLSFQLLYIVHIDGKSTIGHAKEQPSRDSQSALIFYAKRVAFNENKRATIGMYKSRFSLDDQSLVDFYMPLSIGLELLELGSPVHSSFSRHLFERFQNTRHHALESTKVNVRSTL
jgi:hypothetical protein